MPDEEGAQPASALQEGTSTEAGVGVGAGASHVSPDLPCLVPTHIGHATPEGFSGEVPGPSTVRPSSSGPQLAL